MNNFLWYILQYRYHIIWFKSYLPAGGRPVHHSWQPAGKCAPCQPEAAAGRTAGQGAGPDAQPGHDGPDGGEPL